MYACSRSKWTFVTKVTRRKECVLVTKRTRRKHCTFVTKCVRFEKKFYWTKRCYCKNANSSLMDTVALATIRVTMERNGTIAKAADINSHLAKQEIRSLLVQKRNCSYTKRPFSRPFCMLTENDLYLQIASLHLYHLQILLY